MIFKTLGNNVRNERKLQNLTQEQLAEKADISTVFLSQIENARKVPSLETVYAIASALGLTMENIFSEKMELSKDSGTQIKILLKNKTAKEKEFLLATLKHISNRIENDKIK